MKRYLVVIGIAVLAILVGFWAASMRLATPPSQGCPADAKVCPDGSAVGRTGPNCEFEACPAVGATSTPVVQNPTSLQAKIGQSVSAFDITLTPLSVLEDSRCPSDVQCIQAGTVRLAARLKSASGEASQEFKLNQSITTESDIITLTNVLPIKKSTIQIKNSDYVFIFKIEKRSSSTVTGSIAPYTSGVRGTVSLGPTCPVMRDPPDPGCADKPYATVITVRRTGSTSVFATGQSATDGTFQFALPPGSYTLSARGGETLPRCSDTTITVSSTGYTTAAISCDTGIR